MPVFVAAVPTFAVSAIYCIWHAYGRHLAERRRRLRERVAFLLWSAVTGRVDHAPFDDDEDDAPPPSPRAMKAVRDSRTRRSTDESPASGG